MKQRKMSFQNLFALPFYTMLHPADGFYDMRYEHKGKVVQIFINLFLFWISYSFNKQYAGILVNENYPLSFNTFLDLASILLVFLLFCVANWSITTLMNGEGRFVDIAMAFSYALMPMILTFIPATLFSNLLADTETAFYWILIGISIAWFAILLFMGILTIHNYTVGKTLATIFTTFLAICVILFLSMLFLSLLQQVWMFAESIYTELLYRA